MTKRAIITLLTFLAVACAVASAQKYNVIDKTVAVVGNEVIQISDIENAVKERRAQGMSSDQNVRCEVLENILVAKLFLMQARIDSLTVNSDYVEESLSQSIDRYLTYLGGEEKLEEYFGKPLYRLRQEWRKQYEDESLQNEEQRNIMNKVPEMTPYDVKQYLDTVDAKNLPIVPIKYQLSQICLYPDREAANLAVRKSFWTFARGLSTVRNSRLWPGCIPRIPAVPEGEENLEWLPSPFSGQHSQMPPCP